MKGLKATLVVLGLASLLASGCGSARRREPLGIVPPLDAAAVRGRTVFMASCHACHPGGEAGLGPALNDKPLPEFLKRFQVRHGLGAMPAFPESEISDGALADLMAYLGVLRRSRPAPSSGPAAGAGNAGQNGM